MRNQFKRIYSLLTIFHDILVCGVFTMLKSSFLNFIENKEKVITDDLDDPFVLEAIMAEMPMPAIRYKNKDTGEYEDKLHHVSSTIPVFTDWDDIMYLYQFPPEFWPAANAYRYNKVLYEVKKDPNFDDYQDVSFVTPGRHSNKITFKHRNTFAHNLLDKIERTVDTKHFSKSDKNQQLKQQYQDMFAKNKENKIDMGGFIGADLHDPQRSELDPNLWASKSFVGPDVASVKNFTTKWLDASSHGLLGDADEGTYPGHKVVSLQGGRNAKRQVKALNAGKLIEIAEKMKKAGAVPFVIHGNSPVWENVEISGKSGTKETVYPPSGKVSIPILFPGKAIDSRSSRKYELQKHIQNNISNIKLSDLQNLDAIEDEQRTAKQKLQDNVFKTRKEKEKTELLIKNLEPIVAFGRWLKEKQIVPTEENLSDLKIEFARDIHSSFRDIAKSASSYDPYDWNVHRFNKERHEHDPLETGMANPLRMGDYKFPSLRTTTHGYGMFYPNRQNKSMIHGEEGDWENYLSDYFGTGEGEKHRVKSVLNEKEFNAIQRKAALYASKIGEKLASDPETVKFLGTSDPSSLSSPKQIMRLVKKKESEISPDGNVKLLKNGSFESDSSLPNGIKIPEMLKKAFPELSKLEVDLGKVHAEVEGNSSKSDILRGVEDAIATKFGGWPKLKAALEANKAWIVYNAENVIKRNSGETPYRQYIDAIKDSTISPLEKYKSALEARIYTRKLAKEYTERIAQLDLESIGTRRLRGQFATFGQSVKDDEGDDMAYDTSEKDVQNRVNMRGNFDAEAQEFLRSYFGDMQKSRYRKNRASSDSATYTMGHAASTINSQIAAYAKSMAEKVKTAAEAGAKKLASQNDESEATSAEKGMLQSIGTSIALYDFFKQMYSDRKIGLPANADKWAREKMMNVLKRNNISEKGEGDYEGLGLAMRHTPADAYERRANVIMRSWEYQLSDDASPEENKKIIDSKIDALSQKVNVSPNPEEQKRIIDRLCIMNQRKPIFGTFSAAAFKTQSAIPDVPLPSKVKNALGMALNKMKNRHAATDHPEEQPAQQQTVKPPVVPNVNAIAGSQQMQQKANPLGDLLRRKKQV